METESFGDIKEYWNGDVQDGKVMEAKTAVEKRALTIYKKNLKIHHEKAKSLNDIAPTPKPGEQHVIITEKQFNAFALILHLIQDSIIEELYLAIYRINQPTVKELINLMDAKKIKCGRYVISNFFNQTKKPEKWALKLRDYCENSDRFEHIYTHNHAKVLACRTEDGNHYVFEGSGNMSDNARIEQYRYENNKQSYEFHRDWMKELTE